MIQPNLFETTITTTNQFAYPTDYYITEDGTLPSSGIRAQIIKDGFEAIYCLVNCQNAFFVQRAQKEMIMIILSSAHVRLYYGTSEYIIPYLSPRFRSPKFVYMSRFIV